MSTIRKRSNKYQVQVRVQGQKITKSFNNLRDAIRWAVFNKNKILLGAELQSLNKKISLLSKLDKMFEKKLTPDDMTSFVLKYFTNAELNNKINRIRTYCGY